MKNKLNRFLALTTTALAMLAALFLGVPHRSHAQGNKSMLSYVVGTYDARAYSVWGGEVVAGNSATGSQTITICANGVLPDGRFFNPLATANATFAPITIDPQAGGLGSTGPAETVTPTAISAVATPVGAPNGQSCANVTASFGFTHGPSLSTSQVISGDQGIEEAVIDASNNGGGDVYYQADTGNLTLSTGSVTTTSTASVPTGSFVGGASCRVITTITTAASYSLGIAGATTAYVNASTQLTATNVQQVTFLVAGGSKIGTTVVPGAALTPLIITTNANPGAGALHCRAWGHIPAQSAF